MKSLSKITILFWLFKYKSPIDITDPPISENNMITE